MRRYRSHQSHAKKPRRGNVFAPFAGLKINHRIRYALLAGTMLPAAAFPQASVAQNAPAAASSQDVIILAQASPQGEPQQKGQPKGVQPKGPPPKAVQSPPPGPPPGGGQPPAASGQPKGPQQGQ